MFHQKFISHKVLVSTQNKFQSQNNSTAEQNLSQIIHVPKKYFKSRHTSETVFHASWYYLQVFKVIFLAEMFRYTASSL